MIEAGFSLRSKPVDVGTVSRWLTLVSTVCTCLLASTGPALPESIFASPYIETRLPAGSVIPTDWNRDGIPDLVIPLGPDEYFPSLVLQVAVYLGLGNNEFQESIRYSLYTPGHGASEIAVADFNSDGRPDLVWMDTIDDPFGGLQGSIAVVALQQADGSLGAEIRTPLSGSWVKQLLVADFNQDGHPDLVSLPWDSPEGKVVFHLGTGDGTFGDSLVVTFGAWPNHLAVGDFDGDRRPDLAVALFREGAVQAEISFLPSGIMAPPQPMELIQPYPCGSYSPWVQTLAAGDLDGDGLDDLVVGYGNCFYFGDGLWVYRNIGPARFEFSDHLADDHDVTKITLGDVNLDGKTDIAFAYASPYLYGRAGTSLVLGRGDGKFDLPPEPVPSCGGGSVAFVDADRDSFPDMVCGNFYSDGVLLYAGHGDGTFGPRRIPAADRPIGILSDDLNADGLPDLVVAGCESRDISIHLGSGGGRFQPEARIPVGGCPADLQRGDLNGDGAIDLAVRVHGPSPLVILLGNGQGAFVPGAPPVLPNSGVLTFFALGNFDGAPGVDLIVQLNSAEYPISWLLKGNGDGTFAAAEWLLGGLYFILPDRSVVADLNQDGMDDLVVATAYEQPGVEAMLMELWEFPELGLKFYVLRGSSFHFMGTNHIPVVADFNADGALDLAISSLDAFQYSRSTLRVFAGNGDGSFREGIELEQWYVADMAAGDFNLDGHLDLAFPGPQLRLGNGDGTFGPLLRFSGSGGLRIVAADFDQDDRLDLALAGEFPAYCDSPYPGPPYVCRRGGVTIELNQGPYPVLEVEIDVRPDSEENVVPLGSLGYLPAAILATETFDPRTLDPRTLRLGDAGVGPRLRTLRQPCPSEDVNLDGLLDIICRFPIQELGIEPEQTTLVLQGETRQGRPIHGEDQIRVIRTGPR